jgi:hypothetical protein
LHKACIISQIQALFEASVEDERFNACHYYLVMIDFGFAEKIMNETYIFYEQNPEKIPFFADWDALSFL